MPSDDDTGRQAVADSSFAHASRVRLVRASVQLLTAQPAATESLRFTTARSRPTARRTPRSERHGPRPGAHAHAHAHAHPGGDTTRSESKGEEAAAADVTPPPAVLPTTRHRHQMSPLHTRVALLFGPCSKSLYDTHASTECL